MVNNQGILYNELPPEMAVLFDGLEAENASITSAAGWIVFDCSGKVVECHISAELNHQLPDIFKRLEEQLQHNNKPVLCDAKNHLAFVGKKIRTDQGRSLILVVVFEVPNQKRIGLAEENFLTLVCGALIRTKREYNRCSKRLEQLLAEQETLRHSYAEMMSAAVAEREERIQQQQQYAQQLQQLMMLAADGIFTVNEDGKIETFNKAASEIFGYESAEIVGKPVTTILPSGLPLPETVADSNSGSACYARREATETIGRRKDGSSVVIEVASSRIHLGGRWVTTAIVRDITRRKAAEEQLRRLHLQNQSILNSAGEGIIGLDLFGRAVFVNPAAAELLGIPPETAQGTDLHKVLFHQNKSTPYFDTKQCPICPCLQNPDYIHRDEYRVCVSEQKVLLVQSTFTPIRDEGNVTGVVLTLRDITEQKNLEAQLRQAQKLESIGQLAAGIAHEINTPTQYIGDNTRFLQDAFGQVTHLIGQYRATLKTLANTGKLDANQFQQLQELEQEVDLEYLLEEIPRALEQSLDGLNKVTRIVRSMKELSHPDTGEKQPVDINRAIENAITVSRNEWKYVADVVTELDPNLPPVICHPGEISQAILNLVVNAAHAIADKQKQQNSREKGRITVITRRDGNWVEIRVEDTGTGIPKAIRSRIFDPFFTTKEVGRGTGQGLAIVHAAVVQRHHGTVSFETEEGVGTSFMIRLPLEPVSKSEGQ